MSEIQLTEVKNLDSENEWAQGMLLGDEWANSLTHGLGLFLSFIGFFFLLQIPLYENDFWKIINFSIYGSSLIILYAASTFYHAARRPKLKKLLRLVDHCAIYLLIAGSYTPFTLLVLRESGGWFLFSVIWALAFMGIICKIFFRYRFKILSTCLYLFMGWLVLLAVEPLMENLHINGLYWLIAGGLFYTTGVVFYALDKKKFYHAIWHLFVLGGSACHYFAIWLYLL